MNSRTSSISILDRIPRTWLYAATAALLAIAAAAILWRGALPFETFLMRLMQLDQNVRTGILQLDPDHLRRAVRFSVAAWSLAASAGLWLIWLAPKIHSTMRMCLFELSVTIGCSTALFLLLMRCGYEAPWYPLDVLMKNPKALPVFGHRLLWVWVANFFQKLHPSLSYNRSYLLSQIAPIVLSVVMIAHWSSLFIQRNLRWIGQFLLAVMLPTTFDYFNFYDISIVFFYALCLWLLYRRRYIAFAIAVGFATLNHENALLLVVLAASETFQYGLSLCAKVTVGSLACHVAARAFMQVLLPTHKFVDWRIWTNLAYPFVHPRLLVESALALMFWWIAAAIVWPTVDPFLRRMAILLPMLLVVTFLYGQLHEARQFDAMIPVVIGFILSFANAQIIRPRPVQTIETIETQLSLSEE